MAKAKKKKKISIQELRTFAWDRKKQSELGQFDVSSIGEADRAMLLEECERRWEMPFLKRLTPLLYGAESSNDKTSTVSISIHPPDLDETTFAKKVWDNPSDAGLLRAWGWFLYEQEREADAARVFLEGIPKLKKKEERINAARISARLFENVGQHEDAKLAYELWQETDPSALEPLTHLALAYETMHEDEAKREAFLLQLWRRSEMPHEKQQWARKLAELYERTPQHEERAIEYWKLAHPKPAEDDRVYARLCALYENREKWQLLMDLMHARSMHRPEDLEVLLGMKTLADRHLFNVQPAVLASIHEQIIQRDPSQLESENWLFHYYEAQQRWQKLAELREHKVKHSTSKEVAHHNAVKAAEIYRIRLGQWPHAIKLLKQVIAEDPKHELARQMLEEVYIKQKAWKELVVLKQDELKWATSSSELKRLHLTLAKLASEKNDDPIQGLFHLKAALELDPNDVELMDHAERAAEVTHDDALHTTLLKKRLERQTDPQERIKVLYMLGEIAADKRHDLIEAAGYWRDILAVDPTSQKAARLLRHALLEQKAWDELYAVARRSKDFEGLVEHFGKMAEETSELEFKLELSERAAAIYEEELQEPNRALRSYERVLQIEPHHAKAQMALLNIYRQEEKWAKVATQLQQCIENDSYTDEDKTAFRKERVQVLCNKLADPDSALPVALELYQQNPRENEDILLEVVDATGATEQLKEAYVQRLSSADESFAAELKRKLAALALNVERGQEHSVAWYRELLKENPGDLEALKGLERIYRSSKNALELAKVLQERAKIDPERGAYLYRESIRLLAETLKDHSHALRCAQEACLRYGSDKSLWEMVFELSRELSSQGVPSWRESAESAVQLSQLSIDPRLKREYMLAAADDFGKAQDWASMGTWLFKYCDDGKNIDPTGVSLLERLYSQTTDLENKDVVRSMLTRAYGSKQQWQDMASLFRMHASELGAQGQRDEQVQVLDQLAVHAEERMADYKQAYEAAWEAFVISDKDAERHKTLTRLARYAGKDKELSVSVEALVANANSDERQLLLGYAFEDAIHLAKDMDAAEKIAFKIVEDEPRAEKPYAFLVQRYGAHEEWQKMVDLYQSRLEVSVDAKERRELLFQVCFIYDELLEQHDQAIKAYERLLEEEPDHEQAMNALMRLYQNAGRHEQLSGQMEVWIARLDGLKQTEWKLMLADVYMSSEKVEASLGVYEDVLETHPDELQARAGVERLMDHASVAERAAEILRPIYERAGRFQALCELQQKRVVFLKSTSDREEVFRDIARIHEEKLKQYDAAMDTLAQALSVASYGDFYSGEFKKLSRKLGSDVRRTMILESIVEHEEAFQKQSMEGQRLLLVDLTERYLETSEWSKARDTLEKSLSLFGEHSDILKQLWNVAKKSGDEIYELSVLERYYPLVSGIEGDTEQGEELQVTLLRRMAHIQEMTLQDSFAASETLAKLLRVKHIPSLAEELKRLYAENEDWSAWLELGKQTLALGGLDKEGAVALRLEMAARWERTAGGAEHAIEFYREVLDDDTANHTALIGLTKLYEKKGDWISLLEILGKVYAMTPDLELQHTLVIQMAGIKLEKLQQPLEAIGDYASVLKEVSPKEPEMGEIQENSPRYMAVQALLGIVKNEEWGPRLEAAERLLPEMVALLVRDQILICDLLSQHDDAVIAFKAAEMGIQIALHKARDPMRAYDFALNAVKLAAQTDTFDQTLRSLEMAKSFPEEMKKDAFAKWENELLELEKGALEDSRLKYVLLTLSEIAESKGESSAALLRLLEALEKTGWDGKVASKAEGLSSALGDWDAHARLLKQKSEQTNDWKEKEKIAEALAEVYEYKLHRPEDALQAHETILELQEAQGGLKPESLERLVAYHRRNNDSDGLKDVYERQLEMGGWKDEPTAVALGKLLLSMGATERAVDVVERFVERNASKETIEFLESLQSNESQALRVAVILESYYLGKRRWSDVVRCLQVRIQIEQDPADRIVLLRRLAQVQEDYLENLENSQETYVKIFECDPSDVGGWETAYRISKSTGDWKPLALAAKHVLKEETLDRDTRLWLSLEAAEVFEQKMSWHLDAIEAWESVVQSFSGTYGTDDLQNQKEWEVFNKLSRALSEAGSNDPALWVKKVECLERESDRGHSLLAQVQHLHEAAEISKVQLHNNERAELLYQKIIDLDAQNHEAWTQKIRLLEQRHSWQEVGEALEQKAYLFPGDHKGRLELASFYKEKLRAYDKAVDALEDILSEQPAHPDSVALLETMAEEETVQTRVLERLDRAYQASLQWRKRVAVMEAKAAASEDRDSQVSLYACIAELHEKNGDDWARAFHGYARAFKASLGREIYQQHLERLALRASAWKALEEVLQEVLPVCSDTNDQARILATLGKIQEEQLHVPETAILTYENLFELDHDAEVLSVLELLYTRTHQANGLMKTLQRMKEQSRVAEERVELMRRMASLAMDELKDHRAAVTHLEHVLEEEPNDAMAIETLIELYGHLDDGVGLEKMLQYAFEHPESCPIQNTAPQWARFQFERKGDVNGAVDTLDTALLTLLSSAESFPPEAEFELRNLQLDFFEDKRFEGRRMEGLEQLLLMAPHERKKELWDKGYRWTKDNPSRVFDETVAMELKRWGELSGQSQDALKTLCEDQLQRDESSVGILRVLVPWVMEHRASGKQDSSVVSLEAAERLLERWHQMDPTPEVTTQLYTLHQQQGNHEGMRKLFAEMADIARHSNDKRLLLSLLDYQISETQDKNSTLDLLFEKRALLVSGSEGTSQKAIWEVDAQVLRLQPENIEAWEGWRTAIAHLGFTKKELNTMREVNKDGLKDHAFHLLLSKRYLDMRAQETESLLDEALSFGSSPLEVAKIRLEVLEPHVEGPCTELTRAYADAHFELSQLMMDPEPTQAVELHVRGVKVMLELHEDQRAYEKASLRTGALEADRELALVQVQLAKRLNRNTIPHLMEAMGYATGSVERLQWMDDLAKAYEEKSMWSEAKEALYAIRQLGIEIRGGGEGWSEETSRCVAEATSRLLVHLRRDKAFEAAREILAEGLDSTDMALKQSTQMEMANIAFHEEGNPELAMQCIEQVLEQDPYHIQALDLAISMTAEQTVAHKLFVARRRLLNDPLTPQDMEDSAKILFECEALDKAEEVLLRLCEKESATKEQRLLLCDIYVKQGKGREATFVLQTLVDAIPQKKGKEFAELQYRLAMAYLYGHWEPDEEQSKRKQAIELLEHAFKLDLSNINILYQLAIQAKQGKDWERAQKNFRSLLLQKIPPQSPFQKVDLYIHLAECLIEAGEKDKALPFLEKALLEQKENPTVRSLLASIRG